MKKLKGYKTPATGKAKMKAGDKHAVLGKRPPKKGSTMNADPKAKANWRARNTSKVGMGGAHPPKIVHKRLRGVMI